MRTFGNWVAGTIMLLGISSGAQTSAEFREEPSKYWNFEQLQKVPEYRDAGFPDSESKGLKAILFDGLPVNGKKSPVFAYVGIPGTPIPPAGYPGIVLIHGGGGTAFPEFVKLWNSYGYAVIALDWYNQRSVIVEPSKEGETQVKMAALPGGRRQNHIVNAGNMVLAHSLLRSLPNVDKDRIGFVGLSWGSWYGAMVAAIDPRFRSVIEIYCGDCIPKKKALINGRFLHAAKVPMYWIAGTNDQNVTPESLQRAFNECPTIQNKSLVIQLPHSHTGFRFRACERMADHFLKGLPALPKLGNPVLKDSVLSADILQEGKGIRKALLCYTTDITEKTSHKRVWKTLPATVSGKKVSTKLPPETFQCFLSVYDEESPWNDCCGSSDLLVLKRN